MYSERPGWSRSTRGSRNDDTSLAMRAEGTPMVRARPFLWLRWQLLEDQHREIAFRREIVFANLELRGVDPPYAFGAETHQAVGVEGIRRINATQLEVRGVDPPYAFGAETHQAVGVAGIRRIDATQLEVRGVDPPYAFGAETHQAVGVALVDHQVEILDRTRPEFPPGGRQGRRRQLGEFLRRRHTADQRHAPRAAWRRSAVCRRRRQLGEFLRRRHTADQRHEPRAAWR